MTTDDIFGDVWQFDSCYETGVLGNRRPRPYQLLAAKGFEDAWQESRSAMAIMATGTGKTTVAAIVAKNAIQEEGKTVLFLAHRNELIKQAAKAFHDLIPGAKIGIEQGGEYAELDGPGKANLIVASKDSLSKQYRLARWDWANISRCVIDECFPAGTLVDGVPIERISVGDFVDSFNHNSRVVERKRVLRVFKSRPNAMVTVCFESGRRQSCTAGHPFFVNGLEYIAASSLQSGMMVSIITGDGDEKDSCRPMRVVRSESRGRGLEEEVPLLLCGMQKESLQQNCFRNNEADEREVGSDKFGKNEEKQPDEVSQNKREVLNKIKGYGMEADDSWWKRDGIYAATETVGKFARVGHGSGCSDSRSKGERFSDMLQTGCGERHSESRSRSERLLALLFEGTRARQEEEKVFGIDRVAGVEFHEPSDRCGFGELCPGGFVYNIEVDGNHNYFANGVLVHNCHHYVQDNETYHSIIERLHPDCKIGGITASPNRTDEQCLGQTFGSVAYVYDILDAINQGYLVPIRQDLVFVEEYKFDQVRSQGIAAAELTDILEEEKPVAIIACAAIQNSLRPDGSRSPTLIFCPSVKYARMVSTILNRWHAEHGTGPAAAIDSVNDQLTPEIREEIIKRFRMGSITYMVNWGIFGEGTDFPEVEVVLIGRNTDSELNYSQWVGRGTRPSASIADSLGMMATDAERREAIAKSSKPYCKIIDVVGVSGKHKLNRKLTVVDLLGGKYDASISEKAKKLIERRVMMGQSADVVEALKEALNLRSTEEAERRQKILIDAKLGKRSIDPFDLFDLTTEREPGWTKGKPATEGQKRVLMNAKVAKARIKKMSFHQASKLIGELISRRNRGLCTYAQARMLASKGYNPNVTFEEARATLDILSVNGWRSPA